MFESWRAKNLAAAQSGGTGLTAIEDPDADGFPDVLSVDTLGRASGGGVAEVQQKSSKLNLSPKSASTAAGSEPVAEAAIMSTVDTKETEKPKTIEEWGSQLVSLQMKLDQRLQALMLSHKEHEEKLGKHQSTMEDRIRALHQEACSNPLRGGLPSCQRLKITDSDFGIDLSTTSPAQFAQTSHRKVGVRAAEPVTDKHLSGHAHDHNHHSFAECMHSCRHAADHTACTNDCKRAKARERAAIAEHVHALDDQLAQIVKDHAATEHEMNDKANAILRELCAEPFRQGSPACKPYVNASNSESADLKSQSLKAELKTSAEWGAHLGEVQAELDTRLHHLSDAHRELKGSEASAETQGGSIQDRIESLQDEMCKDPKRHSRPMCKKLLAEHARAHAAAGSSIKRIAAAGMGREAHVHSHESLDSEGHTIAEHMAVFNADLEKIAKRHADAEKEINDKAMALGREMCADSSKRHTPACEVFFPADSAAESPEDTLRSSLSSGPQSLTDSRGEPIAERSRVLHMHKHGGDGEDLEGSDVIDKKAAGLRGVAKAGTRHYHDPPVVVSSKDLLDAHWAGHIPKVACIMSVPTSHDTEVRLREAIENFRAQRYEGPKELILIYKHQDEQTANLVHTLADGFVIKYVAAHNDEARSTTAMRFGAWHSDKDAEIIARWDIDDWHDPQRLALQVRALGFTGRPASLLKRVSKITADGNGAVAAGGISWAGSLVGERAWMEKHWFPFTPGEDDVLEGSMGLVAQLDMPELSQHTP